MFTVTTLQANNKQIAVYSTIPCAYLVTRGKVPPMHLMYMGEWSSRCNADHLESKTKSLLSHLDRCVYGDSARYAPTRRVG